MTEFIDLRSDTVTQPSEQMREAMYKAVVGDDIMGEDPTVRKLEEISADILGKQDALFVTSGTMGNQIAVMTLTNRGEEVIVGDTSHIYNLEVGALAALSQVQTRPIEVPNGIYDINKIEGLIQEQGIQRAKTSLICIENTNNLNAGFIVPLDNINNVCELAKKNNILVHLDGARIFNAAVVSKVPVKELVKNADTVMFALTKGLSSPFGAILAGNKDIIKKARWMKQRIGGGYRQAGFLAAPGIIALKTMMPQLEIDHRYAKILGEALAKISGLKVDAKRIDTNIITGSVEGIPITIDDFLEKLMKRGIKAKQISKTSFRMVTHYGIEKQHLQQVVQVVEEILDNL
ncbi:low specificity L-threonine aldolase [Clostridium sp.]|uniref:threonine aldolase family protein n=1 Tax=Clostridium sp. TaxID=1506 RepID=UPI001A5454C7|nr:GntG family PLP-dependent aldolase [Clostridium sp.]MBK5241480.1 aminotransferase class I/II-fold pyridoxal phosphate-dependent enzyme [Clostridium sp.]